MAPLSQASIARIADVVATVPAGARLLPPLVAGDQGLSATESAQGDRLIASLLTAPGTQYVVTYRAGLYEIHGRTGVLSYRRFALPDGSVKFQVASLVGTNPIPSSDGHLMATVAQEVASNGGAKRPPSNNHTSYPELLRRVAQIFDSPKAPDVAYVPTPGGDSSHPGGGSHGSPDVTQSRAPLIMAGPGIAHGVSATQVHITDIAPTIAQFLGIAPVVGETSTGARRVQFMRWQDGNSIAPAIADARRGAQPYGTAQRAVVFVLDGSSKPYFEREIASGHLPNVARLASMGVRFQYGSLAEYPSVTWPNHNSMLTGATPGHTGIINNAWYDRQTGGEHHITDNTRESFRTAKFLDPKVETLYEAVTRTFGPGAVTASLNDPATRGASLATLEFSGLGLIASQLWSVVRDTYLGIKHTIDPKFTGADGYRSHARQDVFGEIAGRALLNGPNPPKLSVFEFTLSDAESHKYGPGSPQARAAWHEIDERIGHVLGDLDRRGLTASTMFVVTADHGMEYQGSTDTGGWSDALRRSGVKAVDDARYVYIRNMLVDVAAPTPLHAGQPGQVIVQAVDDDTDAQGRHKPAAGARVQATDPSGRTVDAVADAEGIARLSVQPAARGTMRVTITDDKLTTEARNLPIA